MMSGGGGPTKKTTFALDDDDEEEDVDVQLQAALAMSLQSLSESLAQGQNTGSRATTMHIEGDCQDSKMPASSTAAHMNRSHKLMQKIPYTPVEFHSVMWDSTLTTEQDKLRWIHQSINVHENEFCEDGGRSTSPHATSFATAASSVQDESSNSGPPTPSNMLDVLTSSHLPWGLVQHYGGPCGVLAAVQAELLRLVLFDRACSIGWESDTVRRYARPEPITHSFLRRNLASAMGWILARAALVPVATISNEGADVELQSPSQRTLTVQIVLPTAMQIKTELDWSDLEPWDATCVAATLPSSSRLSTFTIEPTSAMMNPQPAATKRQKFVDNGERGDDDWRLRRLADAVASFLESPILPDDDLSITPVTPLDYMMQPGGVMLFTMSVVATRGASDICQESDDNGNSCKLTSQFGHCSQELMNLLLTGQAVSNVFDHTLEVADVVCRGISCQPQVGYLSQLEALRYCQVGEYYKNPKYPVWVVGSTSHFTVLFGGGESLEESESDKLLERCRRVFKRYEKDECGFIDVSQLPAVSQLLEMNLNDHSIQTIAATIEVAGAGIILWDDFWKTFSRLLTGASIESVLQGGDSGDMASSDGSLPMLVPVSDAEHASDAILDSIEDSTSINPTCTDGVLISLSQAAARASSPMLLQETQPQTSTMSSDEALARLLQAEWDAEVSAANNVAAASLNSNDSVAAVHASSPGLTLSDESEHDSLFARLPPTPPPAYTQFEDSKQPARRSHEFEQYGNSFSLYHYNGLRGGVLARFRVTRLTSEEAVGASIALNRAASTSGSACSSDSRGHAADLEDVVRTRWPSCGIDWQGSQPPRID